MQEELIQHRLDKLARIRARGDNPYKYTFHRSCCIAEARETFENGETSAGEDAPPAMEATLAGRIVAMRTQGKVTFADLRDRAAKIQLFIKKDTVGAQPYDALKDLDLGDFIGAHGRIQRTKTREITLFVDRYELLTKSLRALPEKYHGLTDVETRYRQRYLDMVANPDVIDVFTRRIMMIEIVRQFLLGRGFLEVETPILHPIPGGATARPFITHHNTYHRDLYLRVAPELYLKRLIVGGFEKVFEINRNFRNEGIDKFHNPEFTMLELYEAYQDYLGLMGETEELFCAAIEGVCSGLEFSYQGDAINAQRPWKRLSLFDSIREFAGIDLDKTRDRDEAAALAESAGVQIKPEMGYGKIVDEVMSLRVKPRLIQPTFLYDYPIEISPLAKKHRDNPALTERYQAFIGGMELCNAFSELNDPIDQRERFEQQRALRDKGDQEAQMLDEDFLTALEIGMPPTAGLGIGIDRLAMLVTDSASIRDVIIFPQLRPIQQL
jgi:lysyl-tRNA synthetase class 2